MTTEPPYTINPADLDNDQNPTGAWTVGEQLDEETRERLARFLQQESAAATRWFPRRPS